MSSPEPPPSPRRNPIPRPKPVISADCLRYPAFAILQKHLPPPVMGLHPWDHFHYILTLYSPPLTKNKATSMPSRSLYFNFESYFNISACYEIQRIVERAFGIMPEVANMRPCKTKVARYYKYAGLYSTADRKILILGIVHV